ncbi:MAG: NYN domain-containing protein [Chlorobi bacterium]|nr:NYN domain-containing protein [Chlorobiota bacterium]MCI0716236.1 NYN domain-containing protein [Chlorobiota bacterium]
MIRVSCLIDGFNLYHSLHFPKYYHKYKWLDLASFTKKFIGSKDSITGIYYFTALATWNPNKVRKHKLFIRAQELNGVEVIYGEFRRRDKKCRICNKQYETFEEKQTDVNIAVKLMELSIKDGYDKAIIFSGDSDLVPVISSIRNLFSSKRIGIVIPIGGCAEILKQSADFYMKVKEKHLRTSLLPDTVKIDSGLTISCPPEWK